MLYRLEQGRSESIILAQCRREGSPVPDAIANAPTLRAGLELYDMAWWDLHSCRAVGFGEGPIPWSAIRDWAQAHDLDAEQREDIEHHIRALDNAYLAFRERTREK